MIQNRGDCNGNNIVDDNKQLQRIPKSRRLRNYNRTSFSQHEIARWYVNITIEEFISQHEIARWYVHEREKVATVSTTRNYEYELQLQPRAPQWKLPWIRANLRCAICKGVLRIYFLYYARRARVGDRPPQHHVIWHKQCISHSRINNNYSVQH